MNIMMQIGIVFIVCLIGEGIATLLPISFPASVISMIVLFILLLSKLLKPGHIKTEDRFFT